MNWKQRTVLAIDTETTGLSVSTGHAIVEIALVVMHQGEVVEEFTSYVNPQRLIPLEAMEINGITDDMVRDAPTLNDLADGICEAVLNADVVTGHNFEHFDLSFLTRLCPGFREAIGNKPILDTLTIVRLDEVGKFWPGQGRHKLPNVVERLGLIRDEDDVAWHGAFCDAMFSGRVLWACRDALPDDVDEAVAYLTEQKQRQGEEMRAWRAQQRKA